MISAVFNGTGKENRLTPSQKIEHYTKLLIIENSVLWLLGMALYAEPYSFWHFAVSYLGATRTPGGYPNCRSLLLFVTSMLYTAYLMMKMAGICREDALNNGKIYRILYVTGSFGAIVICYPHNLSQPVHSIGAGALVFSHVMLTLLHMLAQRNQIARKTFIVRILLLAVPILIYAYCWAVWLENVVQIYQKIAFSCLFLTEWTVSRERLISREGKLILLQADHLSTQD